uniref:Rho GTPase activating protein 9 n=1 Tax=Sphaeramia orbicularis TaxID=375764 RepID=A0A672ZP48_9TELE
MLSGTWRRSMGHQQPAAAPVVTGRGMTVCGVPSGTVVLEAQYDYNYRGADGRQVCIREGERFILLKKTNADWWQVRRIGAASKTKPLYVPATYVTEVPIVPSPQRLVMSASLNSNLRILPRVSLTPSPTEPTYNELYRGKVHLSVFTLLCSSKVPTESYLSQLSWQVSPLYSDTQPEKRQSQPEPPCPAPGQQPLQIMDLWEQYSDSATGRWYYVNSITKERSWKPPRRARARTTTSKVKQPTCTINTLYVMFSQELEKAGLLNKTKIAEGGRKLRKSWSPSWVVLVGNSLVFFKDPKSQTPSSWRPGNSRPESSVDLRGAQLHWANDLSSKKNVFKLRTVTGNEFLLQSETDSLIKEWYKTIQNVIDKLDRENPLDNVLLYSLRRAGSVEMLDHSGDEDERRTSLPRSSSNLENTERKRVKTRLKKLILKRPPLQALQEKGLIKDQVFGCRLEMLCEREKSTVPRFVRLCTEAVERRGLDTDGIYRVSGNLAVIQKLRFLVNHERAVTTDGRYMFPAELVQEEKLNLDESEWEDIHVITGALKLFFRELPEPLVPYGFFTDIVETCLVLNMPPPNHDTLLFMCRHLKRVLEHSDTNRMTTQNIGIVFGPTLMRPERDNGNMAVNMVYQNQAVELILSEYEHIFGTRGFS